MVEKKKILIYTDAEVLGDGIIKLPFISALKKADPNIHLTWLCRASSVYKTVLKEMANPLIDELICLEVGEKISFSEVLFSKLPLGDRKFDIILDTQTNLKRSLWLRRFSCDKFITLALKGLLSNTPIDKTILKERNTLNRLMKLGGWIVGKELIKERVNLHDDKYIKQARKFLPEGSKYVGFVLGAGQKKKIWPLEKYFEVIQYSMDKGFVPVFILGPNEKDLLPVVREKFPDAIIPPLDNLYLTMAITNLLEASVSNDCGGGHIVAFGAKPMVSIYRTVGLIRKCIPASPKVIYLHPQKFGLEKLEDLPVTGVIEALEELLP